MKKHSIIGIIANAAALTGGEWELIAPYGEFPTANRQKIQKFGRAEADKMVATFNSVWHQLGTLFRGVPIFHGHPDVDPKNWPDDRRLGKIVELRAGATGLEGKPEFNALGLENKAEGWWVYPSPAWLHPLTSANVIEPDELLSIGLVNTPNIPGSQPWANSTDSPAVDSNESPDTIMKDKLCALLGLDPATATDDDVVGAITTLQSAADTAATETANSTAAKTAAEILAEEEKRKAGLATASEANTRKVCADLLVANAVRAGVITEADRAATTNSLIAPGADLAVLGKALVEKKPALNTGALDLGGKKVAISTARERSAAIATEVNSRMQTQKLSYDQAYAAVEADPQFSRLFEMMQKPGETEG